MALNLSINNLNSANIYQRDALQADVLNGSLIVSVQNTAEYIPGTFAIIGKIGSDTSEPCKINGALSANNVRLENPTIFKHGRGAAFTLLYADQIRVYRADPTQNGVQPDDSAYILLDTINITYDETRTIYNDATGSQKYWYKATYYNSVNHIESSVTDTPASNSSNNLNYAEIEEIRLEAGFAGADYVTDDRINRKRNAAQQRINGMLAGKYVIPFTSPIDPQISDLTTRLAAAYLMIEEYGAFDGTNKTLGAQKRDDAIAELKDLQTGASILVNAQGVSVTVPNSGGFASGFNEFSPLGFSREDIIGYNERIY